MTAKRPFILIVDDAPEDIAIYKRHLTRGSDRRYKIREATTGAKALAICQRRRPDCVLLDFRLPDLNGLEILQALADKTGMAPFAVIMLAEIGDTHVVVDAMKYGAHDFLEKSWINPEMLERAIANAIEKAALQREVEEQRRELAIKNVLLEQQLADLQREVNERRHVEEALTTTERRFKRLVEALPGVVWMSDENGSVTYKNDYWTELTGLTVEEGLGDRWAAAVHPDDLPRVHSAWKESVAAGLPHAAPHRYRRWDGEFRWHLCRSVPMRDESGAIREWVGVSIDIHDRYEAEKALGESEARYRALVEASAQLVWTADANGIGYRCWEWWSEVTGVPAADLASGRWMATVHQADRRTMRRVWRRSRETRCAFEIEFRLLAKDGEYRHYSVRGVPLDVGAESEGRILWIGTLDDVTDRRLAEEALKLANERFTVAEVAANGYVYDRSLESDCVERSEGFAAVLGYNEGEIAESFSWWKTLIHPDDVRRISGTLNQTASGRGIDEMDGYSLEYRLRHKDGRYLWVWDRGRLMRDETGRPTRTIGSVVDISARKQIENSLRESESRLKLAIAAINGGAWEWDLVSNEMRWSDEMYELFDFRPSDFTPTVEGWLKTLSEEDRERAVATIESVRRGGDAQLVYCAKLHDGEARWLELRGITLHDDQGRPVLMSGITIDITERKLAEEALRESEEKFSKVFKSSSHRIVITTLDEGYYVDVNDAVLLATGYDRSEMMGRRGQDLEIFVWPEGRDKLLQKLRNGPVRDLEVPLRSKNGEIRTVAMSADIVTINGKKCVLAISNDITERKRAEEALRESEERFRTLADTIPSITWIAAADGTIIFHNRRWFDYCGVAPEENDDWTKLVIHHEDLDRCFAEWDRAYELQCEFEVEMRLRRSDGQYRWFLIRATPTFDAEGLIVKWFGVATDIHDRRQAEQALRESEERLKLAMEAAEMFVWETDLITGRVAWSDSGEQMVGLAPGSFGGTYDAFLALVHPDDRESVASARKRALDGEASYEVEYRKVRPDGGVQWGLSRGIVHRDEESRPVRFVGVNLDITKRKQAEEELRENRRFIQSLIDAVPAGIYIYDLKEKRNLFTNPRLVSQLGYTLDDAAALGADFLSALLHPADWRRGLAHIDTLREAPDGCALEIEYRMKHRDGGWRWIAGRDMVFMRDTEGRPSQILGVAQEVTERKLAEERLQRANRRYQITLDALDGYTYEYNVIDNTSERSKGLSKLVGFEPEEASPKLEWWTNLIHPDDRQHFLSEVENMLSDDPALRRETHNSIEYRLHHRDGHCVDVLDRCLIVRDAAGQAVQVVGVVINITERKRVEEALREKEERLRMAMEAANAGSFDWDIASGVIVWTSNRQLSSIEQDYETWRGSVHPQDIEWVEADINKRLGERRDLYIEYRVIRPDGSVRWVSNIGHAFYNEAGQPTRMKGLRIDLTDRKRAEELLRESEERLRLALEGAKAGVWEVKFVPYSAYWSKEYRDLFGFSEADEATNEVWATRIHPADLQRVVDANNALLNSGKNEIRQEFRIIHPEYGERWILDFVRVRRDQAGRPVSFGGINLDVTDRRRAEEALRESEERFRELVSTIPNVFWVMRPESQAPTYLSPACERLWGRPETELNARVDMWFDAIHPEDRERVRQKYLARAGEGDYDETYRVVRPDGSMVWVHDRGFPVCDEAGNIRHIVGVAEDITDRKRFEDELRESELRYAALAEAVPQLVWTAGPDGGIDYFNQRWYAYTETSSDESLNQGWRSLIHPDDHERVERSWKRGVKAGEHLRFEFRLRSADSAYRWFIGRGVPYREERRGATPRKHDGENGASNGGNGAALNGGKGRIVKWFGTFTDIHDLKMAEEALRESEEQARRQNAELENIYQATPVGLSLLDRDFRYVRLNETMAKIEGVSVAQALGRKAREATPIMANRLEPVFKRVIKTGRPIMNLEIRAEAPREPGVERDWLVSYYPVKAADGSVQGIGCVVLDITERKRSEEAARENEERLRQAAQAGGFGLYSVNLQTGEYYLSPELRRIFGLSDDDSVVLEDSLALIHPDDREETTRVIKAALDPRAGGDGEFEHEFRARLSDVNTRWALARGKTVFTGNGRRRKAARVIGVAFDITKRREDEGRLHASEELFRTIFDLSGIGILQIDPSTGIFLRANRELCDWLGYSESELVRMKLEEIVHPDDLEDKWTDIGRLRGSDVDEHSTETRCVRKDGRVVWGLITSRILRDASGRPFGAVTAVTDITERKRAEEALRESERRLKLSLAAGRAGTWEWRIKEDKLILSAEYYDLYGMTPDDLEPTLDNFMLSVHPDDRDRILAEMSEVLQERKDVELEFRFIRVGGDARWAHSSAQLTLDESGEPEVLVGIMIDITERKQAEMEREDLLRKEREAREQAEAANRGKDEFVAMVSHELRSPLNAMLGWAKILKKGGVDPKTQSHAVEVIERSARAQQTLIEDLLDMARIVGGKLRLETRPVSLARVVEAAVDVVRPAAEAREIELQHFINSADEVTGDPDRLQQVVWNLLSNAVKFTMRGGSVEVILERVGASAQITVTDTGRGIKAEDLPYIFDRFRQADSSGSRRFAGLGLGLALVKHLVELHGGQVYADSPGEGKGASFIVRLPVRAVRGEATPARGMDRASLRTEERDGRVTEREARAAYPTFPLDGVWALIVDDEADARELIATLLKQYGARVTVASCAAEAYDKLRKGEADARPDVLVSDISMPDEDGYMLIERVRKLPPEEGGKIPAIALTALERPNDRIKALASGFSMHVPKPVEPEELAMVIANLTGHPAGIIL
jgi:PAS domain S-box-containing protein